MAAQTWPDALPVGPESYSESTDDSMVIRTQPDNGPVKMRRRFTKAAVRGTMSFTMSIAQRAIFKDFHSANLNYGTERFNFLHPWEGTMREFRITSQPKYSSNGPMAVTVSVDFELF